MPKEDETKQGTEEQQAAGQAEPHGDAGTDIDWKAEARKWEARAKENKEARDWFPAPPSFIANVWQPIFIR